MFPRRQAEPGGAVSGETNAKKLKPPAALRPSSSVLLLSPTNQVLLLHRVHTSSAFASAHVFPGGNLSSFHEGPLPAADSPALHEDGPAYRLAAIRETFEESGILLARKPAQGKGQGLLHIPDDVREEGRKLVHENKVKFVDWLRGLGGEPDVENLVPFTRWITPHGPPKRFTTQMYLYMLPLTSQSQTTAHDALAIATTRHETIVPTPTHDGGLEHTAATFDYAHAWLAKARANNIILFPPQFYLLHLVSAFLTPPSAVSATATANKPWGPPVFSSEEYRAQRAALLAFLAKTPTTSTPSPNNETSAEPDNGTTDTSLIPWSDKVISPTALFVRRRDGRLVLGLDRPGPELRGVGNDSRVRGGDGERVVLVRFRKEGPRDVEVRCRAEVVAEEREDEAKERREGEGSEGSKL